MDLGSLMLWRASNRQNYKDVCQEFRRSLEDLLINFVPSPTALLTLLTDTHALLSGEFALCYMLQDASLTAHTLDIYVGSVWFDVFMERFDADGEVSGYQTEWFINTHLNSYAESRHVTDTLDISLSNGNMISVHAAASPSACHAIACSPTSLGTTFITEFSFAIAYPRLTLNRRAIVCWDSLAEGTNVELDMYARLEDNGFSFEEDPTVWAEYSGEACHGAEYSPFHCLRELYLCPQQGRYFGDEGSMVCFMDTLSVDVTMLKDRCVPPYGISAVWRLPSNVLCDAQCEEFDDIIAPGVIATSIMFQSDTTITANHPPPTLLHKIPNNTSSRRDRTRSFTV